MASRETYTGISPTFDLSGGYGITALRSDAEESLYFVKAVSGQSPSQTLTIVARCEERGSDDFKIMAISFTSEKVSIGMMGPESLVK
jgi:hypothetical protein